MRGSGENRPDMPLGKQERPPAPGLSGGCQLSDLSFQLSALSFQLSAAVDSFRDSFWPL
jgi:hypothetical protein